MKTFKELIEIIVSILLFVAMIPLVFVGLLIVSLTIKDTRFEDDTVEEFR